MQFSQSRLWLSWILKLQYSPSGSPYWSTGNPCSYNAWPPSCRQLQVMLPKSCSSILVVTLTSLLLKLVVNGCRLISCLPASKSNPILFKISRPNFHWSSLLNCWKRNESSTVFLFLIASSNTNSWGFSSWNRLSTFETVSPLS